MLIISQAPLKVAIVTLFLLAIFGNSYAASNKEEYELQVRCGKQAQEFYKRDSFYTATSYKNHYNRKLNKCFIEIQTSLKDGLTVELYDINENKEYGYFGQAGSRIYVCYGLDKHGKLVNCPDFPDIFKWDALVKPYMEE